ncbi:ClpP/crotonase-like domain-containing protein [Aspergillus pseudotamarii]|uniref:ClpP/crotonase-like domain-containing protein n=1 Tax=Aspergillus pseudotamarii TaxID=132259 RepID=A0A5N6S914_ASPPS|nr:ClpP/crotonase-like domain-containing protein [Aspergillus pseudotamarii]KAE8131045.1 ClpP/crotonase-like domain-containing protein [Aspergillus pseudotamarii]
MSDIPQLSNVAISLKNGVAILKYDRPKAGNALNVPMIQDILSGFKWAEQEDEVKVILQTGGGNIFTAGLDLKDKSVAEPGTVISDSFLDTIRELHRAMINSNKILVAAVNGPAPGWGTTSLALADLVYASPSAVFFTPFVQLGIAAEACSSITFSKIMGHQKAASLLLAGDKMTANELENAGLVTKVLPVQDFLENVLQICYRIASQPPEALQLNKNLLMRTSRQELLDANEAELQVLRTKAQSPEARSAVNAFLVDQGRKEQKKAQSKL